MSTISITVTVTEEALQAATDAYFRHDGTVRDSINAAVTAGLPHLTLVVVPLDAATLNVATAAYFASNFGARTGLHAALAAALAHTIADRAGLT